MEFTDTAIAIPNAAWWLPHSHVLLKGLYLTEDDAYIQNQAQTFKVEGANTANVTAQGQMGSVAVLKVQRMVRQGTVAIMLRGGAKYEVSLPSQANKLTITDLNYIIGQIDVLSQPMSVEEQQAFLACANGHLATNSETERPYLKSL